MRTELIVATYQNPHALALCLASVARQGTPPDSIAIADDGSGPETAAVIADAMHASDVPIRHVWHPDTGFQKNAILNRAIATSDADFLVFIDGDVLIRPDFLDHHRRLARPDRWSSGSLIRLDAAATQAVSAEIVTSGEVFTRRWLRDHRAIDRFGTWLKARPLPLPALTLSDRLTPVQKAWGGANARPFARPCSRSTGSTRP